MLKQNYKISQQIFHQTFNIDLQENSSYRTEDENETDFFQ